MSRLPCAELERELIDVWAAWSAPSAIGTAGAGFGLQMGAEMAGELGRVEGGGSLAIASPLAQVLSDPFR